MHLFCAKDRCLSDIGHYISGLNSLNTHRLACATIFKKKGEKTMDVY